MQPGVLGVDDPRIVGRHGRRAGRRGTACRRRRRDRGSSVTVPCPGISHRAFPTASRRDSSPPVVLEGLVVLAGIGSSTSLSMSPETSTPRSSTRTARCVGRVGVMHEATAVGPDQGSLPSGSGASRPASSMRSGRQVLRQRCQQLVALSPTTRTAVPGATSGDRRRDRDATSHGRSARAWPARHAARRPASAGRRGWLRARRDPRPDRRRPLPRTRRGGRSTSWRTSATWRPRHSGTS